MSKLMIRSLITLLILALCNADLAPDGFHYQSPSTPAYLFTPFPSILWAYQPAGVDGAPLWNKISLNNYNHFSKISGFEFRFLSDKNITQFLSPSTKSKYNSMVTKLQNAKLNAAAKNDLVKAIIMYEHGGLWFDPNSYFTRDFNWTQSLYKWPWVYNRLSANPEVFFMSARPNFRYDDSKNIVFDDRLELQVHRSPGLENWLVMAKPKSLFYTDILESIAVSLEKGRQFMEKNSESRGIIVRRPDFLGDYQLELVLKTKQRQLQSKSKYAVEHYKMWNMYSESSGLFLLKNIDYAEMEFPPFMSIKNLNDISGYQTDLLFIKYYGGAANEFNSRISKLYNRSCKEVSHHVQPQSLFYQTLVNVSSMFPEVDSFKETFSYIEGRCNPLNVASVNIHHSLENIKQIIAGQIACLVFGILMIFCCGKCCLGHKQTESAKQ